MKKGGRSGKLKLELVGYEGGSKEEEGGSGRLVGQGGEHGGHQRWEVEAERMGGWGSGGCDDVGTVRCGWDCGCVGSEGIRRCFVRVCECVCVCACVCVCRYL